MRAVKPRPSRRFHAPPLIGADLRLIQLVELDDGAKKPQFFKQKSDFQM